MEEEKKVVLSKDERVKNSLFTNFASLGKVSGSKRAYFDAQFIFECVKAISEREGRTMRFVMLALLESGLKHNELFKDSYEAFSREWAEAHGDVNA